ncbi:MAG: glyoxalase [Lachnospiraceae bacterium]|nr:glyoxalase [Lachnospiraceae bacterium]
MMEFDDIVIKTFLEDQLKLFPEPVAETEEEAQFFLEDVCAIICDDKNDVIEYVRDEMDASDLSDDQILELEEVFRIPDGRYLIVEG